MIAGREPFAHPHAGGLTRDFNPAEQLVLEAERARDAAMLLGHQRPYREFPREWVEEALSTKGFDVKDAKSDREWIDKGFPTRQLNWARTELNSIPDKNLSKELHAHISRLQAKVDKCPGLNRMTEAGEPVAAEGPESAYLENWYIVATRN